MGSSNHVAGTLAVAVLLCVAARLRRRCRILNDPTAHARDRPSRASTTAATAHASSAQDRSSHSKPPTPSKAAKKARRAARRGPSEAESLDHYSLTLEYDGTSYCGSQKQISHKQSSHKQSSQDEPQRHGQRMRPEEQRMRPEERGRRTVQGDLESALTQLIGWQPSTGRVSLPLLSRMSHLPRFPLYRCHLLLPAVFAGRTDKGVHALANVVHLELPERFRPLVLLKSLNAILPESLGVVAARKVPRSFHARHSAVRRTYVYRIRYEAPGKRFVCASVSLFVFGVGVRPHAKVSHSPSCPTGHAAPFLCHLACPRESPCITRHESSSHVKRQVSLPFCCHAPDFIVLSHPIINSLVTPHNQLSRQAPYFILLSRPIFRVNHAC